MKTSKLILSAILGVSFFVITDQSVKADDLSNPGVSATSVQYAALSGYAIISADGTNALAQLVTETARATAAETNAYSNATNGLAIARSAKIDGTNALAQIVIETNRAQVAEAINATQWVGRVSATEIVATNGYNQATNALAIANAATIYGTNTYNQATNALAIANSATVTATNGLNQATNALAIANNATTNWNGRMDAVEIVATNSYNQATNALAIANSAFKPNATNLLTEGWLDVIDATNLVFISNGGAITTSVATWIAP